jgi:hypothetical protein
VNWRGTLIESGNIKKLLKTETEWGRARTEETGLINVKED